MRAKPVRAMMLLAALGAVALAVVLSGAGATTAAELQAAADAMTQGQGDMVWWMWPLILLGFCFVLGVIAVLAGVGGGVLFVPLVSGFFPSTSTSCAARAFWWPWPAPWPPGPVSCATTWPACVWPCPWP